jgi:hypothetical protein
LTDQVDLEILGGLEKEYWKILEVTKAQKEKGAGLGYLCREIGICKKDCNHRKVKAHAKRLHHLGLVDRKVGPIEVIGQVQKEHLKWPIFITKDGNKALDIGMEKSKEYVRNRDFSKIVVHDLTTDKIVCHKDSCGRNIFAEEGLLDEDEDFDPWRLVVKMRDQGNEWAERCRKLEETNRGLLRKIAEVNQREAKRT